MPRDLEAPQKKSGRRQSGRPRMYATPAEKQRAYRERQRRKLALLEARQSPEERLAATAPDAGKPQTGLELLQALTANGFIGLWKDRTDIGDSAAFARELRQRVWTREPAE